MSQNTNHQLQITNSFVLLTAMELRKDPITLSWVITGDDVIEPQSRSQASIWVALPTPPKSSPACRLDKAMFGALGRTSSMRSTTSKATGRSRRWISTAWDLWCTRSINRKPAHNGGRLDAGDVEVEQFLRLAAQRVGPETRQPLEYISIFKNHGEGAGQEFEHPTSS